MTWGSNDLLRRDLKVWELETLAQRIADAATDDMRKVVEACYHALKACEERFKARGDREAAWNAMRVASVAKKATAEE